MKSYDNFMNIMSSVMDILPRFLELSENNIRTYEEEKELKNLTIEIETLKIEIIKLLPEINKAMSNEFINNYMKINKGIKPEIFFNIITRNGNFFYPFAR